MAITFIYPITVTGHNSLNYDTETKEAKMEQKDGSNSLNYVMRDKKGNTYELSKEYLNKMKAYISVDGQGNVTFKTISSFLNCGKNNTYKEWQKVRDTMNRSRGNTGCLQYCIVQNFGEDLDPMLANEIGVKFAREYLPNYQCVVSTHINTGHVHNHIEFNATSFVDGKKYNRCTKETREIRRLSDRLCDEYGLEVLEATREMKLKKIKTIDGKTLFYEPTDRKNQKKDGEYANKNDYRNTVQYASIVESEKNHSKILREDLERMLPHATSYEDLLRQLRNLGYDIKAKTKDGSWRKHVSFKLPEWDKYVRDSHLGDEYTREVLSKKLNEPAKEPYLNDLQEKEIYVYGRMIIEDLDEEYRYKKKKNTEEYEKKERSQVEKIIIRDVKKLNQEVNNIIKSAIHPEKEIQEYEVQDKKKQYLIDRINANLRTLRFVEQKGLRSFEQINDIVGSLCEKRDVCYQQVKRLSEILKRANRDLLLIQNYRSLKRNLKQNAANEDYRLYEMENDRALLKEYERLLKEKDLMDEQKQQQFESWMEKYKEGFTKISFALEKVNRDIQEYDDCITNISRIDRQGNHQYEKQIQNYFEQRKSRIGSPEKDTSTHNKTKERN